ncbi:hypothetical protein [uncultured Chitinophaga sp.]|uniref:hypothetical protein n=1 Tax=uncultured Chitinophaga sp. TaxID=339340 RepID=UPI002601D5A4|nr:hypothetical protein [uncultured Chitinophaga sp.]
MLIVLNNELNGPLDDAPNQQRLRRILDQHFTPQRAALLNRAFHNFRVRANGRYENDVFGSRYLIAMLIKEFNRNLQIERADTTPDDEFNILMAYFLVVDEVNKEDELRGIALNAIPVDHLTPYRWAWTNNVNQFEYTDLPHPGMNIFKLLCLCKYAKEHYRPFLKEYLNSLGFNNLAEFMGSFVQLAMMVTKEFPEANFKKTTVIEVQEGVNPAHLDQQCINTLLGTKVFGLADLKQYPLYNLPGKGYCMMDRFLFLKKMFIGPFFELLYNTSMRTHFDPDPRRNFNPYSSIISTEVLEKLCFQGILKGMRKTKHDVLSFDEGDNSIPDGYFRNNKTIFLFEFKGYIFPASLTLNPDFTAIKNYIDNRFVANERGRAKGVGQLANQIALLQEGQYVFDPKFNATLLNKRYTIYPIICHTEYYFAMPGVNDYLNDAFRSLVDPIAHPNVTIKDLAVVDLTTLLQLAIHGKGYSDLQELIDRYLHISTTRKKKYARTPMARDFYNKMAGFDEIYRTRTRYDLIDPKGGRDEKVAELLGIQDAEMLEII